MNIPEQVSEKFVKRELDDVLGTTTDAERAGQAADSVREDCFKQHVARVHEASAWLNGSQVYAHNGADKYFEELWALEENRILEVYFRNKSRKNLTTPERKQFNNKSNPFRSMKSIVRAAMVANVPLVDEDGMPLGKTALQQALKQERDPVQKFITVIRSAQGLISKLPETDTVTLTALKRMAEDVVDELDKRVKSSTPF